MNDLVAIRLDHPDNRIRDLVPCVDKNMAKISKRRGIYRAYS